MGERMDFYPVTRHVARCRVEGCTWRQEHIVRDDARRDGERHLAEWHPEEVPQPPERPSVVSLMEALEASLAAVKEGRA